MPSAPNARLPVEWLGYCWQKSFSISRVSLPAASSRDSVPVMTQPSPVAPGGVGQPSGQRGIVVENGSSLRA